jgi:hypothetical protein
VRRKLKNLKNKGGHSENGAPRQLLDETVYRNRLAGANSRFDSEYGGWGWATRPRDQAISLRRFGPTLPDIG